MAGSARPYSLFRRLPEFGFQPIVLTVKPILYPAYDNSLLRPGDHKYITRTESLDPARVMKLMGRRQSPPPYRRGHLSTLLTPDYKKLWNPFALTAAKKLIKKHSIRIVITTTPPPSTHMIGLQLKKTIDVKWIADFRDAWVSRRIEDAYSSTTQRAQCLKLLSEFRNKADRVVAVNESIGAYVHADTIIPNGADNDLSRFWIDETPPSPIFCIGYLGTPDLGTALESFVKELAGALRDSGEKADKVEFRLVGVADKIRIHKIFESAGLAVSLKIYRYLPKSDAFRKLSVCDLLLATIPAQKMNHVTPSKIYDYLISGKSIVAIAPVDSELAMIVRQNNHPTFEESQGHAIRGFLTQAMRTKATAIAEEATLTFSRASAEEYGARMMAQRYSELLSSL